MKILALETSTLLGSAALICDGDVVAEKSTPPQKTSFEKSNSEVLNLYIEELLKIAGWQLGDLDGIALGQGPGSFTGIRIAGNVGKTLAYSLQKPLVAIDTLSLLASPCDRSLPVLAMINAYKNMVYYGLFKNQPGFPEFIQGPGVMPVKSLETLVKQECLVIGDGYTTYQNHLPININQFMKRDSRFSDLPKASTLGLLSEDRFRQGLTLDWKSFVPLYIRASEAEETKRGLFIPPL